MSHPELRPKEGSPADVGKSLQEQLAGKVDPSELPETREETRPGKLSGEIAGLLSKMYSEPERYAAFAGQKQRLEEMAGGLVAVDDLSVRRGNAGLREIEAELQEIKQELGLLPGETEAGGTPAAVPAAESVAASEASSPPPAPAPRPARPTKKPDNGEQARNGEAKENEAVLAAIEEALQRARAFVGSLSREDKRDSAQVRAHAKEIDQADRQLQLAKRTDANLKDAFWRLKVAADIQIIDKNISQCQQVLEAKRVVPARPGPRRSDGRPPAEPRPALAPEVAAEARAQLIDDRAAEIRTKREAGGAEANVEVDARIAAAGASPFTPEADAIAQQWDREQAAKQIDAEEAAKSAPKVAKAAAVPAAETYTELVEEREFPLRAAAWYTVEHLNDPEELQHDDSGRELTTPAERQVRFAELVKKYWTDFTLHGAFNSRELDSAGKPKIEPWPDLDGDACLFLLKEAGISVDKDKINYVKQGGTSAEGIILDTSNQFGVIAEEGGKKLTIDHHTMEAGRDVSAAKMLYELLSNPEIGLLKKEPWLEKFVDFVTHEDNKNYTDAEARDVLKGYGRNFVSLADRMGFEEMKIFFQDGKYNPNEPMPDNYLKTFKFTYSPRKNNSTPIEWEVAKKDKLRDKAISLKKIDELASEGLVLDTGGRFGKVLIDNGWKNKQGEWQKRVGLDFVAARPQGYGAYLAWLPEKKQFFLHTVNKIDFALPDTYNVRGHYLLKGDVTTDLQIGVEEILAKLMGDPSFKMPEELKAAIEEKKGKKSTPAAATAAASVTAPAEPKPSITTEPPRAAVPPEPVPTTEEELDPLAEEMLKLMEEDEEDQGTEKASQAVAGAYNQAVKYLGFRSIFRQKYSPVRFGTQNGEERRRDLALPPDFKTASDGDFLAVPIKGQANRYVVVPRLDITIQEHNFNPGGMVLVYDMPGYDARQRYNNVEVVKPAVFELDGTTWRCVVKGELNLTPGPAVAKVSSALERTPIDFGGAKETAPPSAEPPEAPERREPPPAPAETVTADPEKARMKERLAAEKENAITAAALARRAGDDAAWRKASTRYRRISQALKKLQ